MFNWAKPLTTKLTLKFNSSKAASSAVITSCHVSLSYIFKIRNIQSCPDRA
jgi:hypothetical protein